MDLIITTFNDQKHRDQVISLWNEGFGYESAHNEPELVIEKKLAFGDDLFFVALDGDEVVGTIMAGYDGHRGWIYSLAVSSKYRNQGIGAALLSFAERKLSALGCLKINLQILEDNGQVERFYTKCGYKTEKRVSMGKRLL
jgi:ribosomal protein S18 acetylase RimI-like enzyme